MIKITLPFISKNINFYNNLLFLSKKEDYFFTPISFDAVYGNFSRSYWGGDKNNFLSPTVELRNNINYQINKSDLPLILDISNINLNEQDLLDRRLDMILEECHNGSNKILCNNFTVINTISKKFPNYKYLFSDNSNLIFPLTNDFIDSILKQDFFDSLILNPKFLQKNISLKEIKNKNKIKIKIGCYCKQNCINYEKCLMQEHDLIYNFSEKSTFETCSEIKDEENKILNLKNEIKSYLDMGFSNFIIDSPLKRIPLEKFNKNLILFLKNENNNLLIKELL